MESLLDPGKEIDVARTGLLAGVALLTKQCAKDLVRILRDDEIGIVALQFIQYLVKAHPLALLFSGWLQIDGINHLRYGIKAQERSVTLLNFTRFVLVEPLLLSLVYLCQQLGIKLLVWYWC